MTGGEIIRGMGATTRLFGIVARKSPRAVIFRRGPSRQVLLIAWNTATDEFETGQWFTGRIYERRCDLSPDGEFLVYFAAKNKKPLYSWTAISRPPYLTALALWPKGDGWGGGGLFDSGRQVALNHRAPEMKLADGFALPRTLQVKALGDCPGWGEDDPIWPTRLLQDGWKVESKGELRKHDFNARVSWEYEPPIVYAKRHPIQARYVLKMEIQGIHERNRSWYVIEHAVMHGQKLIDALGRTDWAEWLPNGDLVFTRSGQLLRLRFNGRELPMSECAEQIADFSAIRFEPKEAPKKAQR
jgi:hypothetical protein